MEVRDYYLQHGLSAYAAYKKDLAASIEADIAKSRNQ